MSSTKKLKRKLLVVPLDDRLVAFFAVDFGRLLDFSDVLIVKETKAADPGGTLLIDR